MSSLGLGLGITALTASLQVKADVELNLQQDAGSVFIPNRVLEFVNGSIVGGDNRVVLGAEIPLGENHNSKVVRVDLQWPDGWKGEIYADVMKQQKIPEGCPMLTAHCSSAAAVYINVEEHPGAGGSVRVPLTFDIAELENYAPGTQAQLIWLLGLSEGQTGTLNGQPPTAPPAGAFTQRVPGSKLPEAISLASNFAGPTNTVQVMNCGSYYVVSVVPSIYGESYTTTSASAGTPEGPALLPSPVDLQKIFSQKQPDYTDLTPFDLSPKLEENVDFQEVY
jgi:hypothetical protein